MSSAAVIREKEALLESLSSRFRNVNSPEYPSSSQPRWRSWRNRPTARGRTPASNHTDRSLSVVIPACESDGQDVRSDEGIPLHETGDLQKALPAARILPPPFIALQQPSRSSHAQDGGHPEARGRHLGGQLLWAVEVPSGG